MAGRWLLVNCAFLILCLTQLDAKKSKQHAATISSTEGEDIKPQGPQWSRRMHKRPEVQGAMDEMIILSCPAMGHPKPNIRWLRDGKPLRRRETGEWLLMDGERMRAKNWNLKIFDAKPSQSGNYTCVIRNEHGRIAWKFRVNITQSEMVPSFPVIVDPPMNQTVVAGKVARIDCKARTDPAFQHLVVVKWAKHYQVDGKNVDETGQPYYTPIEELEGRYAFPDKHVLIMEHMQVGDSGWYTCMVYLDGYNSEHISHASIYITVRPGRNVHSSGSSTQNAHARTVRPDMARNVDSDRITIDSDTINIDPNSEGVPVDSESNWGEDSKSSSARSSVRMEVLTVTRWCTLMIVGLVAHRLTVWSMH